MYGRRDLRPSNAHGPSPGYPANALPPYRLAYYCFIKNNVKTYFYQRPHAYASGFLETKKNKIKTYLFAFTATVRITSSVRRYPVERVHPEDIIIMTHILHSNAFSV